MERNKLPSTGRNDERSRIKPSSSIKQRWWWKRSNRSRCSRSRRRTASAEINALSALNEAHGGNSFGTSGLYKFADGGMVSGLSEANRVVKQAESMKLSSESINQLAGVVIDAVMSMPNPVVSVQDINRGQNDVSVVQGLATF